MSEFMRIRYRRDDLLLLNTMRMHKKVIHLSDIVMCDGKTIMSEMLTDLPGQPSVHKFPTQKQTKADKTLWETAIRKISSEFKALTLPLQEYISLLYTQPHWRLSSDRHILHQNFSQNGNEYHDEYIPRNDPLLQQTRSGEQFVLSITRMGTSSLTKYASITYSQLNHVMVHSSIQIPLPPVPKIGFEENLRYLSHPTLWLSLNFDGDGSWILDGLLNRSLIIIHDGLYMKEISPKISAAATMIYCTMTRARCKCTWAEQSDSAGSYRGEILGGIMTQIILQAAAADYQGSIPRVEADYNNNGVVIHRTQIPSYQQTRLRPISLGCSRTWWPCRNFLSNITMFSHTRTNRRNGEIAV